MKSVRYLLIFISSFLFTPLGAQFYLSKSFTQIGNVYNNPISDSNFVFLMQDHDRIIVSDQSKQGDTNSIIIPPLNNYTFYGFSVYDSNILFIDYKNISNSTYSTFYTIDRGKSWIQFNTPSNIQAIKFDKISRKFYFNTIGLNKIYIFNILQNKLDSISYSSNLVYLDNIYNDKAVLFVSDISTPNDGKLAISQDGAKTFLISSNINYNIPPFSKVKNGLLQKFIIVSDYLWVAQHSFDSTSLNKITRVYYSNDKGSTWKILFNFGVKSIIPAGNSTVYVTEQVGPTGELYQVSNSGSTICLTSFKGVVSDIYFWNSDRGLILTADTPNKQPGIWRVFNGGGAPCSLSGIRDNITQNELISLYPNPAKTQITIANYSLPTHSNFLVFSIFGTLVQQGILEEKETKINIKTLASGLYFIKIGDATLKFVKE